VGEHGALRLRFRPAGVDDLRQRPGVDVDRRRQWLRPAEVIERDHRPRRRRRGLARQPIDLCNLGLASRGGTSDIDEFRAHGQCDGTRAAQNKGDLFGVQHEIYRYQNRPDARQGEPQGDKGVRVARQHRDPVAWTDFLLSQSLRQAAAQEIELGVGPANVTASNRRLVRHAAGGAAQEVGQAVLAEPWHRGASCGHSSLRLASEPRVRIT
jgi:hypothetical protein